MHVPCLKAFLFKELIVGRHAQSWANLAATMAERGDESIIEKYRGLHTATMGLTPLGITQARAKGQFLTNTGLAPFDFHFTSAYRRAKHTANFMDISDDWIADPRLNEREWGPMDQISIRERTERWPNWTQEMEADQHGWRPECGENHYEVRVRVLLCLSELTHRFPGKRGIIVAHGETNRSIQAVIERMSPENFNKRQRYELGMDNATALHYRKDDLGILWKRRIDPHNHLMSEWRKVIFEL